ncbi:hypothetical protein F8M41_006560 [Gigaspora margarita]|uniref:Uncharacterized protein n=1 Tax=Gigaspora margarita TaxID=4874 RepID=A0A8H3X749_GIGMA|nr:hypothetical protein F8M41_006560 [Gigaspora margarita]
MPINTKSAKDIEDNTPIEEEYQLYCQYEISLEKAYRDWNKKINYAKEIHVEKDKHEAFKDYKSPTELDKQSRVENELQAFIYCLKYTKMSHVNETIKSYLKNRISIKANIVPNITNNLKHTCEV